MDTGKISSRNMSALLILLVLCGRILNGAFVVQQDTWIAILIMGVMFLPLILLYSRICSLFPEKGMFDIIEMLFGKASAAILTLLLSFSTLLTATFTLRNFVEFTVIIALQNTPRIVIMIGIMMTAIFLAYNGGAILGRWASIVFIVILVNIIATLVLSYNIIDIDNIKPILDHDLGSVIQDSFSAGFIIIGEAVLGVAAFGCLKKDKGTYKTYIPGILAGVVLFAVIMLRNLLILGPEMDGVAIFSIYTAARIIRVGDFLERIESSISFTRILMGITKVALCLSAASMGTAKLLKSTDYKKLLLPMGLLSLGLCSVVFKTMFDLFDVAHVYWLFSLPFQVLIPLLIWIVAEVKTRKARLLASQQ